MHSFQRDRFIIHHNGDYSGDAKIVRMTTPPGKLPIEYEEIEIPCGVLLEFAAEAIRSQRISKLEQMEWQEFYDA